jgi:hypothetical protein
MLHARNNDRNGLSGLLPIGSAKLDTPDGPIRAEPGIGPGVLDNHVDKVFALGIEFFDSFRNRQLQVRSRNRWFVFSLFACPQHDQPAVVAITNEMNAGTVR